MSGITLKQPCDKKWRPLTEVNKSLLNGFLESLAFALVTINFNCIAFDCNQLGLNFLTLELMDWGLPNAVKCMIRIFHIVRSFAILPVWFVGFLLLGPPPFCIIVICNYLLLKSVFFDDFLKNFSEIWN